MVAVISVGVPLISPVWLSNTNPAGKDGEISQPVIGPPVEIGDISTTLELYRSSITLGTYSITGRLSRTVMLM